MSPARLPNDDEFRLPRFRRPAEAEKRVDSQPPKPPEDPNREPGPASSAKVPGTPKEDEK